MATIDLKGQRKAKAGWGEKADPGLSKQGLIGAERRVGPRNR